MKSTILPTRYSCDSEHQCRLLTLNKESVGNKLREKKGNARFPLSLSGLLRTLDTARERACFLGRHLLCPERRFYPQFYAFGVYVTWSLGSVCSYTPLAQGEPLRALGDVQ